MPSLATQCLILYHPEDRERVLQVKAALAGLKLAAWVDVEDLDPGRLTVEQWEEAVRAHPHIFLFWSAAAARDPRWIKHRYLMALEEHGSVIPVCLDEADLPPALRPYWPIAGAGALPAEALACLMEATVAGRRLLTGPRVQLVDVPWAAHPGEPPEIWSVRPGPGQKITPELLREVFAQVAGPVLIVCPHGGATGASRGDLEVAIQEDCPATAAVVISFDSLPYNEIRDKQQVQPAGDARTAWPVTAVWAGGEPVYQVDLGAPAGLARVGPRIPVFRTPGGFAFSLLTMAPAPGDPAGVPGTLAGLFARGLCNLPDGPERLDLCLLLTPDGAWEAPATEVLLTGVGGRPVGCGAVFSHAAGFCWAGVTEPYREAGASVYRMKLAPGNQHRYHAIRPGGAGLGAAELALPLRQLIKEAAQPAFPYAETLATALGRRFEAVRGAVMDAVTEDRRRAILELLHFPAGHDGRSVRGVEDLLHVLANLALGGELDLAREDASNTALWAERTLVAVLNGKRDARPSQLVADFCSRLYQEDERAEFCPYGRSVVLVEHFGVCDGVRTYKPVGFDGELTVTEDLRRETAPVAPETRYCGLGTLQSLLDGCACEDEARERLKEVG